LGLLGCDPVNRVEELSFDFSSACFILSGNKRKDTKEKYCE